MTTIRRYLPAPGRGPDRSLERRARCEQLVRSEIPDAGEISIGFHGPDAEAIAAVWHDVDGVRSARMYRVNDEVAA